MSRRTTSVFTETSTPPLKEGELTYESSIPLVPVLRDVICVNSYLRPELDKSCPTLTPLEGNETGGPSGTSSGRTGKGSRVGTEPSSKRRVVGNRFQGRFVPVTNEHFNRVKSGTPESTQLRSRHVARTLISSDTGRWTGFPVCVGGLKGSGSI